MFSSVLFIPPVIMVEASREIKHANLKILFSSSLIFFPFQYYFVEYKSLKLMPPFGAISVVFSLTMIRPASEDHPLGANLDSIKVV